MNKFRTCVFAFVTICLVPLIACADSPFNRLRDKFGDWKVRHVYNTETFEYRFSDAQAQIIMEDGDWVRFDINRDSGGNFYYSTFGWFDQVIIKIDGETFTQASLENVVFHRFTQDVNGKFLKALSNTNQEIRIGLSFDGKVKWGTISPKGSNAALRWIGAIK